MECEGLGGGRKLVPQSGVETKERGLVTSRLLGQKGETPETGALVLPVRVTGDKVKPGRESGNGAGPGRGSPVSR